MIKILHFLLATVLGLGMIDERPLAFLLFALWFLLIGFALQADKRRLLYLVAPGFPANPERRPLQKKICFGSALLLLLLGVIEFIW